jgi:hypothetical protein
MAASGELYAAFEIDILAGGSCTREQRDAGGSKTSNPELGEAKYFQNNIPMERLIWLVTLGAS